MRIDKRSDSARESAVAHALNNHQQYTTAAPGQSASSAHSGGQGALHASSSGFSANVAKALPRAAAYLDGFYTAALFGSAGAPGLWDPATLSHLHRHNENTKGHTIYNLVLVIPVSCLRALLSVYDALSAVQRSTLGFLDAVGDPKRKIARFMEGLQRLAAAPCKFFNGYCLQFYVGQTHAAKSSPKRRYNAHYSNYAKNLLVKLLPHLKKLVALSNDAVAQADVVHMVTHALFVCGPVEIAKLAGEAGVSMNTMTTTLEDQSVKYLGSMVDDAGGNSVWPIADMQGRISSQSGDVDDDIREGHRHSIRVNGRIRDACAEIDRSWEASTTRATEVRNQVLAQPWDAVCNGDDSLGDVLHHFYGHLDPGTISVRRLLSLLNSYASSQRKGIAVGAKYRAEILFDGKRVWFDRNGGKHAFDEEACEAGELDRTVHVHISEVTQKGLTSLKIISQIAENLPFFKGCHLEDTTNEHWT
jgi:hypothetical protein